MSEYEDDALVSTQYDDLLCRSSLSDTGTLPRTAPLEESPDVIPVGVSGIPDPTTYFTESYDRNVSAPVVAEEANVIYVRGKNLGAAAQNGEVYVYWARQADLGRPTAWKDNQLLTEDGHGSFPLTDVQPEAIAVATTPFVWTPDASLKDTSVVLIGVLATNDHPNPVPGLRSPLDFNRWIARRGGVGAFQTTVTVKPKPTTKYALLSDVKYTEGGLVDLLITATDMPVGTTVSMTMAVGEVIVRIPESKITTNPQSWGTQATLPANFSGTMDCRIALPATAVPGPNNSVSIRTQTIPATPPAGEVEADGPVRPVLLNRASVKFDQK